MKKLAPVFFTVLSLSVFSQNVEDKKPTTEAKKTDSVRVVQQPKIVDMRLKNQPTKTNTPNLMLKPYEEKRVTSKNSYNQNSKKIEGTETSIKLGKKK